MPLESASFINGLDPANPAAGDTVAQADDHIRLIKSTLKASFPNVTGAVTVDQAFLNSLVARIQVLEAGNYIGKVSWNAGATTPSLHLLCHGQAVSRTTYAVLFTAIGTSWGPGNGTTTFNVPDLRGRILAGLDNMGGTNANRMSVLGATATTLGGYGGSQNLHQHSHTATQVGHAHSGTTSTNGFHAHSGSTDVQGVHAHGGAFANGFPVTGSGSLAGSSAITANFGGIPADGAHAHNLIINGDGNHNHTFTTDTQTPAITVTNAGTGTAENIPPVALGNYVIFAGA